MRTPIGVPVSSLLARAQALAVAVRRSLVLALAVAVRRSLVLALAVRRSLVLVLAQASAVRRSLVLASVVVPLVLPDRFFVTLEAGSCGPDK